MVPSIESSLIAALLEAADERSYPAVWRMRAQLEARMDALLERAPDAPPNDGAAASLGALMRANADFSEDAILAVSSEGIAMVNQHLQELLAVTEGRDLTEEERRFVSDELQPIVASLPRSSAVDAWEEEVKAAGGPMAAMDATDVFVRRTAVGMLGSQYMGTRDPAALRRIAELVLSNSQPCELRFEAYDALFAVAGKHPKEWPMTKIMSMAMSAVEQREFKISGKWIQDIDWDFVKSFLAQQ